MNRSRALAGGTAAALRLLAQHPDDGVTVRRLTTTLHLPARTACALVDSLRAEGLVRHDPGTDVLRPAGPLVPAAPPPDANLLRSSAMNWADRLAAHSGLSVLLAVAHPDGVRIVHHVFRPDNSPQRLLTGEKRPAGCALAQVLAAPHDRRCVYAPEDAVTGSLAVAIGGPGPVPYAAALALTGPRALLDPSTGRSARYEALLREAADAVAAEPALSPSA
ncbi:IclR family transcriptional regulator [Streptomyces sp. HU2014]|uniref:IclR family transcriptional regulator n=1 Tax=Streptomyces albireticuli TaxID=1940 RepID=A0A1Z2LCL2_9ACTN|nr:MULTISPECIES: MarR family transcriptional regulator [Streptomyces]ARZ72049.1 IclR family transcriptional regulator [Streptomyces albireticuli]UQI45438.1 IclR family transcriptional regulator [Streptomyces sp. HU2014]